MGWVQSDKRSSLVVRSVGDEEKSLLYLHRWSMLQNFLGIIMQLLA